MIAILKGAAFFLADLTRAMKRDVYIDFMGISSYGKGKSSSGEVKVTKDLDISLEGAEVLIVEDIVDSGITLNYLMHVLDQRRPHSIRIAALLDKPERRLRPVHVSYVGFQIPDQFVWDTGWITTRSTGIWTISACWKRRRRRRDRADKLEVCRRCWKGVGEGRRSASGGAGCDCLPDSGLPRRRGGVEEAVRREARYHSPSGPGSPRRGREG